MEALMQPRVKKHVAYLDDLLVRLEQHLQQRLLAGVHVDDSAAMAEVLEDSQGSDLSLADLARRMSRWQQSSPSTRAGCAASAS
jgi:pyruvate-ferredoxin/flavodoxin oxidoreductase